MSKQRLEERPPSQLSRQGLLGIATISILTFIAVVSLGDFLVNHAFNNYWDLQLMAQVIYVAVVSVALILSMLAQRKNLSLMLGLLLVAGFVVYLFSFSYLRGGYLYHLSKLAELPGSLAANPDWLGTLFSTLENIAPTFIPIVFLFIVMKRLLVKQIVS